MEPPLTSNQRQRVAWITGAGGGLGKALVNAFVDQQWNVVAAYHSTHPWSSTDRLWPVKLDVTSATEVQALARQIGDRWGRLDVLVNNAGVTADRLLNRMCEADWDRILVVNLKGAFLCSQAALPAMLRQREGHILNIASYAARRGSMGQANYAAAKAGLIGMTESLAKEVGANNIRVNAVLPGLLPTAMTASLDPARWRQLAAENALKRVNDIEEVARFVVFLAGMQNVSGQLFQLDSRIARWI